MQGEGEGGGGWEKKGEEGAKVDEGVEGEGKGRGTEGCQGP